MVNEKEAEILLLIAFFRPYHIAKHRVEWAYMYEGWGCLWGTRTFLPAIDSVPPTHYVALHVISQYFSWYTFPPLFQVRSLSSASSTAAIVASPTPAIEKNTRTCILATNHTTARCAAATSPTPTPPHSESTWRCTARRACSAISTATTATWRRTRTQRTQSSLSPPLLRRRWEDCPVCRRCRRWERSRQRLTTCRVWRRRRLSGTVTPSPCPPRPPTTPLLAAAAAIIMVPARRRMRAPP